MNFSTWKCVQIGSESKDCDYRRVKAWTWITYDGGYDDQGDEQGDVNHADDRDDDCDSNDIKI